MSNPETESESPVFKLFGKTIQTIADEKQPQSTAAEAASTAGGTVVVTTASSEEEEEETAAAAAAARAAGRAGLACPRCKSRDTKFCYFNNYNVNQPRHFCKACHRYWTAGGTLRSVPVGSGRRKNRAPPPTTTSTTSAGVAAADQVLRLAGR